MGCDRMQSQDNPLNEEYKFDNYYRFYKPGLTRVYLYSLQGLRSLRYNINNSSLINICMHNIPNGGKLMIL